MVSFKVLLVLSAVLLAVVGPAVARVYLVNGGAPDEMVAVASDDTEARVRRDHGHHGVTGPVHTFVKTDKHAHFKWGVRHHVGHEYAG